VSIFYDSSYETSPRTSLPRSDDDVWDILPDRMKSKISVDDEGCWRWTGYITPSGYGLVSVRGVPKKVHQVLYAFSTGSWAKPLSVLHRCDKRNCCRPSCLFAGTQKDNMRDMYQKGRAARSETKARGEDNGMAKLTRESVICIRHLRIVTGTPFTSLARRFGVSKASIHSICLGTTWKHVPFPPYSEDQLRCL